MTEATPAGRSSSLSAAGACRLPAEIARLNGRQRRQIEIPDEAVKLWEALVSGVATMLLSDGDDRPWQVRRGSCSSRCFPTRTRMTNNPGPYSKLCWNTFQLLSLKT